MAKILNTSSLNKKRRLLKKNQTKEEQILWDRINENQLGLKFKRQVSVGEYVLDFYCASKKLALEIDGGQPFKEDLQKYDEIRTNFLNALNIKVIRFTNTELQLKINEVIEKILKELSHPQSK